MCSSTAQFGQGSTRLPFQPGLGFQGAHKALSGTAAVHIRCFCRSGSRLCVETSIVVGLPTAVRSRHCFCCHRPCARHARLPRRDKFGDREEGDIAAKADMEPKARWCWQQCNSATIAVQHIAASPLFPVAFACQTHLMEDSGKQTAMYQEAPC